ncbi:MAG: GerMN domain-containing protein [Leptospiraceae bacterium]|nr:GerMN domain-containing protein [Leptospiraceae bacterium]
MEEHSQDRSTATILFYLLILFVVLDKGLNFKNLIKPNFKTQNNSAFLLPEINENSIKNKSPVNEINDFDVFPEEPEKVDSGVYFLKFYGSGKQTHSRLVRVKRNLKGNLGKRVWKALKELEKGPTEAESKRGLLTGLPNKFKFYKKVRLKDGVLHISLPDNFDKKASLELIQDRLDQLCFTLFEFPQIKGIAMYIEGNRVRYLKSGQISLGDIIRKRNRKIVNFR